ncbi:MAG TPA: response regulator [Pyrinomonadaceae bacterium]|jgi:two-component system chemotaxis response regulator CheY|nr:response regulator [Pyrinomonadaceae bacterium]
MQLARTQPTILIVEDYLDTRYMLKLLLESLNYAVLTAANGKTALAIAAKNHIDLVVTDFNLPDITGAALIRRLRRMNEDLKRVPIVMLTALDADEYRHLAAEAGCNEFIVKPVDFDTLEGVLDRLVRENRLGERSPALIPVRRAS